MLQASILCVLGPNWMIYSNFFFCTNLGLFASISTINEELINENCAIFWHAIFLFPKCLCWELSSFTFEFFSRATMQVDKDGFLFPEWEQLLMK